MQFRENLGSDVAYSRNVTADIAINFGELTLKNATTVRKSLPSDFSTPSYILAWVTIVNVVLFVVGVSGNAMVALIVARVRTMRVPNNFFLASLAVADLLVLVICQPSALLEFYAKDRWYLGEIMCKIVPFLESTSQKTSILTIAAISFERYNAICRPLRAQYLCSRSRAIHILILLWLLAAIASCPFAGITVLEDAEFYDGSPIKVCRTKIYKVWHTVYVIFLMAVFFVLPLLALILLYSKIMLRLMSDFLLAGNKNDKRALKKLKSRRHSVYMLLSIIVLFFIGLLPARVFTLWFIYAPIKDMNNLGLEAYLNLLSFVRAMVYLNSAANPIVYSLMSTKFRQGFRTLWRCQRTDPRQSHSLRYFVMTSQPILRTPSTRPVSGTRSGCRCKLHIVSGYSPPNSKKRATDSEQISVKTNDLLTDDSDEIGRQ